MHTSGNRIRTSLMACAAALLLGVSAAPAAQADPAPSSAAAVTATVPSATAASVDVQACTSPKPTDKSSGEGTPKGDYALVRSAPSSSCTAEYLVGTDVTLHYHCWVTNSAGNKWTHVRIDKTKISGWVWNGALDDGGSQAADNEC
ncbi:SH3 domain-containing protein [Streptomyces sp. NPDC004749]